MTRNETTNHVADAIRKVAGQIEYEWTQPDGERFLSDTMTFADAVNLLRRVAGEIDAEYPAE